MILVLLAVPAGIVGLIFAVVRLSSRVRQLESQVELLSFGLKRAAAERASVTEAAPEPAAEPEPYFAPPAYEETPAEESPFGKTETDISPTVPELVPPRLPILPEEIAKPGLSRAARQVEAKEAEGEAGKSKWEEFLGGKLLAWLGGLALFMGVAFFIKYSFDRNLIPPWLRIVAGFCTGLGLVAGGIFTRQKQYQTTAQTLVATGIVILYASSFAARTLYGLINTPILFFLMTAITVAAFTLALRLDGRVVAVLGMLGGFLTPQLMGEPRQQPLVLFGYVLMLNFGLLAVAYQRKWRFLISLGAGATCLTELIWIFTALREGSAVTGLVMTCLITALFVVSAWLNPDSEEEQPHSFFAGMLQSLLMFALAWSFLLHPSLGVRPGLVLASIFAGNMALIALYGMCSTALPLAFAVSGAAGLLGFWIHGPAGATSVYWPLGAAMLYALLNAVLPASIARIKGTPAIWPNVASVSGLALLFVLLTRSGGETWMFWPVALMINLALLFVAFLRRSMPLAVIGSLGTAFLTGWWIRGLETTEGAVLPLFVMGAFGLLFFLAVQALVKGHEDPDARFFPAIPAAVPYFLTGLLLFRLEWSSPAILFLFVLALGALLLVLSRPQQGLYSVITLGGTLFVECTWLNRHLHIDNAGTTMAWLAVCSIAFTALPFLLAPREDDRVPWYVAALAGPLHFPFIQYAANLLWPEFELKGIIPAMLGIPAAVALWMSRERRARDQAELNWFTAIFGASTLFFITLIFPVQLERQWLTISWACEGAALIWLYRRAPARWLVYWASALLAVVFVRLALNPMVFSYQERSAVPILNWYLYTYGLAAAALFISARLVPRAEVIQGCNLRGVFSALGVALLFLLMNIEIADFFATGTYLAFEFSGNFARDMTYSIAWSLFALVLLLVGVWRELRWVRYAGLGLMGATLVKLFFHDLTRLDALFRIGAFVGVALILIFASWMYQKFLSAPKPGASGD